MASRNTTGRRPALRLPSRRTRFIFYGVGILLLLIFNIWAANNALQQHRARVPYSPFFVEQIKSGNVESITSTGTAIQGALAGKRLVVRDEKPDHGRRRMAIVTSVPPESARSMVNECASP